MTQSGRRPRSRILIILIAAVVILSVAGYAAWLRFSGKESTEDAQVDGHINPISARVGGTITKVHIVENQAVNAGDVLVEIDPRDYQIAVARAEADLAD